MLKKSAFSPFISLFEKIRFNLFIQTKITPNPNFLKFVPTGKIVMENGTMDFVAARYTHVSPLARKLFNIDGVKRVFYGKDYISVAKGDEGDWNTLKPEIYAVLMDYFTKDEKLFTNDPQAEDTKILENDSETVAMIKEIIETRIRPVVQEDGGDIEYKSFDEEQGVVKIVMKGSCSGCPSSGITLKNGIENMLKHYVAEVQSVESIDFKGEEDSDDEPTSPQQETTNK